MCMKLVIVENKQRRYPSRDDLFLLSKPSIRNASAIYFLACTQRCTPTPPHAHYVNSCRVGGPAETLLSCERSMCVLCVSL